MTIFKEIDSNLQLYIERLINGRINETFRLPFFFHVYILNFFIFSTSLYSQLLYIIISFFLFKRKYDEL